MIFNVFRMEYAGGMPDVSLQLRNYRGTDYAAYRQMYEDCFRPLRRSLHLPLHCCPDRKEMAARSTNVWLLEEDGMIKGAVTLCDEEIDDLIVNENCRKQGIGTQLLRYAVSVLLERGFVPVLHVAADNADAVNLYAKNGFEIRDIRTFRREDTEDMEYTGRKKLLVTGGTVFVSRYTAEYFVSKGYDVYVMNRNTRRQSEGVHLIECDRHAAADRLKDIYFDAVIDVTAYDEEDISDLTDALGGFGQYIMISSSAVYPETAPQPFREDETQGPNIYWGKYGTDKSAAEAKLLEKVPDAYILRPPYLYGEMDNVYREAFVFECAENGREFYIPKDGSMGLQFFHVDDLCRLMGILIDRKPSVHIFNTGNDETVSIEEWVKLCYEAAGREPVLKYVTDGTEQRKYFSFHDYEYKLDVTQMKKLMPDTMPLQDGLKRAYAWYTGHKEEVVRKPFIEYIDSHFRGD